MSIANCPRVVFDCMVFLQVTARPEGPAARLLIDFVEAGRLILFVSDTILAEVRDVLSRPRIRAKNPAITDEAIGAFLARIRQVSRCIDSVPTSFTLPRDPDDEPYLNLAIVAGADYLVTRDKDMLDLMHDAEFLAQFSTLKILDPVALLHFLDPPAPIA